MSRTIEIKCAKCQETIKTVKAAPLQKPGGSPFRFFVMHV